MKAILIKADNHYYLEQIPSKGISAAVLEGMIGSTDGEGYYKLSKQNCDEIFGAFDVEKLKSDYIEDQLKGLDKEGYEKYFCFAEADAKEFIKGFNKAMELNKDKQFTLEDVRNAMDWIMTQYFEFHEQPTTGRREQYLESIQQPNEIEVEILMRNSRTGNIVKHDSDLEWDEDGLCDRAIPKLDSEGCIILKKI